MPTKWGDKDCYYINFSYPYHTLEDEITFLTMVRWFHEVSELTWIPDAEHNGASDYSEWWNRTCDRCMVRNDQWGGEEGAMNSITVAFIGDSMKCIAENFTLSFAWAAASKTNRTNEAGQLPTT
jgi:hypothetical protein